jgi:hypothetical protein
MCREVREIRCCIGNVPLYDFERPTIIAWAQHIETYAIYLHYIYEILYDEHSLWYQLVEIVLISRVGLM